MGRGRLSKVKTVWSRRFAYAIGLIATDGNLSPDGRHISFSSKDYELACIYRQCLGLDNKIGLKARGGSHNKNCFVVQFGDKNLYEFLNSIGLQSAKSKTLARVEVPDDYFMDFLRGCIDGDGSITISKHPESRQPQLRLRLFAYNRLFLEWIDARIKELVVTAGGWIYSSPKGDSNTLIYGKTDAIKVLHHLYSETSNQLRLERKFKVANQFMLK